MPEPTRTRKTAAEFKGRMLSVTRLRVLEDDLDAVLGQVDALTVQIPQAVKGMAILIESEVAIDLERLLQRLRDAGLQPLGVIDGPLGDSARRLGLPVLSKESGRTLAQEERPARAAPPPPPPPAAAPVVVAAAPRPTKVVSDPVRSGQQIYAEGADLVVLNTVSNGAEVIADGCIHIYGTLKGRAIAGAHGDEQARVFCRRFEAELIAIAGIYAVAEQISNSPRGDAAQAFLENGRLKIEPLKY